MNFIMQVIRYKRYKIVKKLVDEQTFNIELIFVAFS